MKKKVSKIIPKDDVLENLFNLRKIIIETNIEEDKKYIEQNNLKNITHEILNKEIESLNVIDNNRKEMLLEDLEKLLENKEIIHMYKCKKYYIAGVNDTLNLIFNNYNKKI